jgi:dipeptidyl-peptidase 4
MKECTVTLPRLVLCALAFAGTAAVSADPPPLSLDRLYRLPWVIGTTPDHPVWSIDSQHVAFLWNDDGGRIRDVWWTDPHHPRPERLTHVVTPAAAPLNGPTMPESLDPGVTDLAFTADGASLVYIRAGQPWQLALRAPHDGRPLEPDGVGAHDLAAVPRSGDIVYITRHGLAAVDTTATVPHARRLLTLPDDVAIESVRLSPDGRYAAFLETDSRAIPTRLIPDYLTPETSVASIRRAFPGEPSERYRVGIVPLAGGEAQYVSLAGEPDDLVFGIAWSPDSHSLLVDRADLLIKHRWIRVLNVTTGVSRTVYEEHDAANVTAEWWADWSADGKSLVILSDRAEDYHVWRVPLDGQPPQALTGGPYAVFAASALPGHDGLLVIANRDRPEDRIPYFLPSRGGSLLPLATAHGHHEPVPSPDGRWLADIASDDGTPPELYVSALSTAATAAHPTPQRVTQSPPAEFERYPWAVAQYVTFPNVHDGTELHGRLTLPPHFDPKRHYPAILGSVYSNTVHNRWGGRVFHPTWGLDQYLAQQGYVLLNVDISGSSGHGKAFRQRIREDYGGVDVEDLYSATQYLVSQGFVDEHRIGLWGSSYGGLLTTMSLMKHPGTYAAGVAGAPATNMFHAETGEMRTMLRPQGHEDRYVASSPVSYVSQLQDPLLLIHGMRDDTVLFKDSLALTQALIEANKSVEWVVLPNAPHGWDTEGLAQTRYAFHRLVDFFNRHLTPASGGN